MKFFQPQLQLRKRTHLDKTNEYFLHIVTFCNSTGYSAGDYQIDDSQAASGQITVRINLQYSSSHDFPYLTPVVHTLALGSPAFPETGGSVVVEAFRTLDVSSPIARSGSEGDKKVGESQSETSSADGDDRPEIG